MFSFGNVDISDVDFNDAWQDGHFPDPGAEFPGEAGERVEGGVAGVVTGARGGHVFVIVGVGVFRDIYLLVVRITERMGGQRNQRGLVVY